VLIPPPRLVDTLSSPGINTSIKAAATIPPRTWEKERRTARRGEITLTRAREKEMAGLNNAPETRKKIHALIARLRPKAREMKAKFAVLTIGVPSEETMLELGRLAMWVPPNARNKNIVVPTNSPTSVLASWAGSLQAQ
jgi:hypothetical protein